MISILKPLITIDSGNTVGGWMSS